MDVGATGTNIKKTDVIAAVEPLLDHNDEGVQLRAAEKMARVVSVPGEPRIDFNQVYSLVRNNNEIAHGALIKWLFSVEPGENLMAFATTDGLTREELKHLELLEHEISDLEWREEHGFMTVPETNEQLRPKLTELAAHPKWWSRLYVAVLMKTHVQFRDAALVERLSVDKHPLVRQTIQTFHKKG